MKNTESKTIRLIDYDRATAHSYIVTKIPDDHVATTEGYGDGHIQYTRLDPSPTTSHYDTRTLRKEEGATDDMVDFLLNTSYSDLEDCREYEVSENGTK